MKKRILSLLLAVSVSASSLLIGGLSSVSAAGNLAGETKNTSSEIVYNGKNTGVIFTEIETPAESAFGLNKIKVVEFDLANRNLEVKAINHGDKMTSMATVSSAAKAYSSANSSKVLAAVNGDLWMTAVHSNAAVNTNGTFSIPRGMLIIDGEIWSTPQIGNENLEATNGEKGNTTPAKFAFGVTSSYQPLVGVPDAIISITNNTQETSTEADGLNRLPADNSLIVYNDRVSDSYALADAVEIQIAVDADAFKHGGTINGTVQKVYASGQGGKATISDKVIVLTARGERASDISGYAVGDSITISTSITATTDKALWQTCQQAIGGHIPAIINGSKGSNPGSGYPSTIIGYDNDGKVMMVTVDGRQDGYSVGLKGDSVYKFCQEIGLNSAFYLDGGGSTTMVTVDGSNYIVRNKPSDGNERSVINSIAVCWNDTQRAAQGTMDHVYNVNDGTHTNKVTSVDEFLYDGSINMLMNDISGQAYIDINEAKGSLVVDLNGFSWTNDAQPIVISTANDVYVYDSSVDKTGKLVSLASDTIAMGQGKLRLKDITITANGDGSDALYINGGDVTVENCTLSAVKAGIDCSNDSESQGIPAKIKVIGGIFNLHPNAEARNCAIELRNNADKDNISIEGDIKFRVNQIISRQDAPTPIKDAITIGSGSTATFVDGESITSGENTWKTATINYVYENATPDTWYAWWDCDFESSFYDSVANTDWVTGNTSSSEGNFIRSAWTFSAALGDPKGKVSSSDYSDGNFFEIGGINALFYDYEVNKDYSFIADINVNKNEVNMSGFLFDYGFNAGAHAPYYRLWEATPGYAAAQMPARYVGNSGIGVSFNATEEKDIMYIYVLESTDLATYSHIEYVVEFAAGTFTGNDFINFQLVEKGSTKYFLLDGQLVAYIECADLKTVDFGGEGTTPGQCAVDCYSKATIYNAYGQEIASTTEAIISVPHTLATVARAGHVRIDNLQMGLPVDVEILEEPSAAVKGDVNGDESVNTKDVALIRRYIAGTPVADGVDINNGDVNADDVVNTKDVALIRRSLAGFDVEFK